MHDRIRHLAVLTVVAVVLVACGTAGAPSILSTSDAPTEPSTARTTPTMPTTGPSPQASAEVVESARHRYRMTIPADWTRVEYDGTWTALEQFGVGVEVPGEDVIDSTALGAFLVLNSMVIPDGMSAAAWQAGLDGLVQAGIPADCPGTERAGSIGGVRSSVLEQTCAGSRIVGHRLTHAGRGYYFTTVAPVDGDAAAVLDELLASIEFLD
jgi:hypothetical protein